MILFIVISLLLWDWSYGEDLIVETPTGTVQGYFRQSYKGRRFAAFEGIPYAQPPIGDLRFKPPQPIADKWDGTLIANQTYTCLQYLPIKPFQGVRGHEDCLYLYIYVPREIIDPNENLDVIIHIHGGAFMIGEPKFMADADYLMDQDIVYVTMNYRLGVMGFLSTGDEVVSGNNGLKDQQLALIWIRDNIRHFGGNPDSITLTGLSAGGASVHYHYLAKSSHGLFHRGFSQSGTALQSWALTKQPLKYAKFIADRVDCNSDTNQQMIDCLRDKPAREIVRVVKQISVLIDFIPYAPFGPVIETQPDGFLTEHPYKLLKDKQVYDVPWINANVKDEGILPTGVIILYKQLEKLNQNWIELGPYCLDIHDIVDDPKKTEIVEKVRQYYFNDAPMTESNAYSMVKMFSDRLFFYDSETATRLHAAATTSPVYYYFFSYLLQLGFFFPMEKGVMHGDDGRLLYRLKVTPNKFKSDDEAMMTMMTQFLSDYAKTGIPRPGNVDWSPVIPGAQQLDYLQINGSNAIQMASTETFASREFWQSLHIPENGELFD